MAPTASQVSRNPRPLFSAISGSVRQLFQLLRCINFSPKAYVQITRDGLKFSAQDSQTMQGFVVLETKLFSSYTYNATHREADGGSDDEPNDPLFLINLDALLETLQIFGSNDTSNRPKDNDSFAGGVPRNRRGVFDNNILGMSSTCKLSYSGEGAAFCIVIEESGVTTTCELNTYEADDISAIPFQADAVVAKAITRSEWLFDAIKELNATSPTKLNVLLSPSAPHFTLSAGGAHGSAAVEFKKDPQLLETFRVARKVGNSYKYSMIKGAGRAMAIASKVSIRTDEQGVLSLQFMVEIEEAKLTFVDFRFVPLLAEDDDGEHESAEDDTE